jgi:E3 ubiquitin-protein ligase DOA10
MGVASLGFGVGDELISPCMCKGTQQFVHRSCLDHWRSLKVILIFSWYLISQFLSSSVKFP